MHSTSQALSRASLVRKFFLLLAFTVAVCGFTFYVGDVVAQMAPANSVIGNQASASYADSNGVPRSSTSNTVQTTVSQVKSFTLLQTGAKSVSPNQQVCYPHTITNTGNGADTYALNAPTTGGMFAHTSLAYYSDAITDGAPDNGSPITSTGTLAPGASFNFVVCGTTPLTATVGQQGTIVVSATDTGTTTLTQTDTTTIAVASISVQKRLSTVAPPAYTPVASGASPAGPFFVVLEYNNSGTVQGDNLALTDVLPAGWLYVPGSGRWSGSATSLTDAAAGDPAGVSYTAPTTAINGTISATIATVAGSTSGNIYFQVTIAPNLPVTTPTNQASTTNTANYQYSYTYFNPIAGMNQTVNVPSTNTNSVTYSVLQTASVAANGSSTTTGLTDAEPVVVATAGPGQTISWTDYIWNTGNGGDSFDITLANTPLNGTACAPANNAAAGQCTFPTGTTFQILASNGTTTLLDSNGNSTPDTGTIPAPTAGVCPAPYIASTSMPVRCGYPIVITATIPATATPGTNGGNGYQVTVAATSFFNNTTTETVPDRLTAITASTVDLTNNAPAPGGAGAGPDTAAIITTNSVTPAAAATTTTRFQVYVNNTSLVPQIYDLSFVWVSVPATGGIANPPVGWTVTFRVDGGAGNCSTVTGGPVTSTGSTPIAAGGNRLICAEVVVPASNTGTTGTPTYAGAGDYVVRFRAQQQTDATVFDTKSDRVTIQPLHNVTLSPIGAQSTVPSGAVTYVHTITNTGNVTETITFPTAAFLTNSQTPTYAWSSAAYLDSTTTGTPGALDVGVDTAIAFGTTTFTLAPNETRTIFVRVNAPAMAGSPPNVTTLTATYNAGGSTVSINDTTSLSEGLRLDKFQQSPAGTGSCTTTPTTTLTAGVPNAPWSSAAIVASANTAPGRCISYLIVGTNTTAAGITNINITDTVPPNTKLELGCGAPVVTGPIALTGGPYITGYTGIVSAISSPTPATPLGPSGTFTLQFCVKINDM